MEYCDMGNLYNIQSKLNNKVFPIDEALNIFNQILKGVEIMHRQKIVHRDLKLENIFVRKTEKSALLCKIGDFGLARFLEATAHSNCGTQNYMAP
jgi:serine/threonine protein kinase